MRDDLSDLDRELLALADAIEQFAISARALVTGDRNRIYGTDGVERQKRIHLQALTRMRLAGHNVAPQVGPTYKDARMRFAHGVFFYGEVAKNAPLSGGDSPRAKALAERVASLYPTFAARLTDPACVELIRIAITAKAKRSRMPWKEIANAWRVVEKGETDRWAVDWTEYRARKLTFRP